MPADVTLLKTKAECDQAVASLTKEKTAYQHRDSSQEYADTLATDRATTVSAQLTKAIDDVAHFTTEVARPGQTPVEIRAAKRGLIAATSRRDNLLLSSETTSGPEAFLGEVDADQVDGQITVLDQAILNVKNHKDTLSV